MFFGKPAALETYSIMSTNRWDTGATTVPLPIFGSPEVEIRSVSNTPHKESSTVHQVERMIPAQKQSGSPYRPLLTDLAANNLGSQSGANPYFYMPKTSNSSYADPFSRSFSVGQLHCSPVIQSRASIASLVVPSRMTTNESGARQNQTSSFVTIYGRKTSTSHVPMPATQIPKSDGNLEQNSQSVRFEELKPIDKPNVEMLPQHDTVEASKNHDLMEALTLIRELMEQNKQLMADGLKYKEELETKGTEYTELWQEIQNIKAELDTVKSRNPKEQYSSGSSAKSQQQQQAQPIRPKDSAGFSVVSAAQAQKGQELASDANKARLQALVKMFREVLTHNTPRQVVEQPAAPEPQPPTPDTPAFVRHVETPDQQELPEVLVRDLLEVSPAGVSEAWLDPRDLVSSREYTREDFTHLRHNSSWTDARASEQIAFMESKFGGSQHAELQSVEPLITPTAWMPENQPNPQASSIPQHQTNLFQLRVAPDQARGSSKERIKPTKSKLLKILAQPALAAQGENALERKAPEGKPKQLDLPARGSSKPLKKLSSRESVSSKPGNTAETSTAAGNSASPVAKGSRLFNPREVRYPGPSTVPELVFKYKTHGTSAIAIVESPQKLPSSSTSPTNQMRQGLVRSNSNKFYK